MSSSSAAASAACRPPRRSPARRFDVTLIDRRNHHLFQPLLYQVATAALSPADIASPIRSILRGQKNATVAARRASTASTPRATVRARRRRRGRLRLPRPRDRRAPRLFRPRRLGAVRARPQDDRRRHRHAPAHPARLRARRARDRPGASARALLTFVVVGGGPTGVEMAGAIAELAMRRSRRTSAHRLRARAIVLVEAGPRVLPLLREICPLTPPRSSSSASRCGSARGQRMQRLRRQLRRPTRIPTRTIIWAAGVLASPAAAGSAPSPTAPAASRSSRPLRPRPSRNFCHRRHGDRRRRPTASRFRAIAPRRQAAGPPRRRAIKAGRRRAPASRSATGTSATSPRSAAAGR